MMKPERLVRDEGSIHRAVAGKEYDEVWDYAEQLESQNAELLKACQAFVHFADIPSDTVPRGEYIAYQANAIATARKAIRKAKGE